MKNIPGLCLLLAILAWQPIKAQPQHILDGYADKQSYEPGETMTVFASGLMPVANSKIYLWDVAGKKADSVQTIVLQQFIANPDSWQNGYGYLPTFTYTIPKLPSGIYSWDHTIYFIIKNPAKNAAVTVVYPSNTDAAYNNSGGRNFYSGPRAQTVSFLRPLSGNILHTNYHEASGFLRWLKALPAYDVQVISDMDMDDYAEIAGSELIVLAGHSEYWTRQARLNFDRFVNSGKNALVLSGNTMWWQVRYSADKTRLICYKDSAADPEPNPLLKTITWNKPSLQYAILGSIGADWVHGAYGRKTPGFGGFKITNPHSPLLKGTNLQLGDTLKLSTIEYDGTLLDGFNSNGYPVLNKAALGFYKAELIGYDFGQNNVNPPGGYGTFIAFQKTPVSGRIINAASMNWCDNKAGIGSGPDAALIRTISKNMLDNLLLNRNIFTDSVQTEVFSHNQPKYGAISVYPNPGSGRFSLQLPETIPGPVQLLIFNNIGNAVFSEALSRVSGYEFDISALPHGTYYYQVHSHNQVLATGQLILMH